jgi:hypothetical protein
VHWSEDAIVMEDASYSLASMSPCAALAEELVSAMRPACGADGAGAVTDEWFVVNCIFVLGELGPCAAEAAAPLLIALARGSESHRVVRMCLASLAQILGAPDSGDRPEGEGPAAEAVVPLWHEASAAAAAAVTEVLGGGARSEEWLVLSSQSGLFCAHDQVQLMAAELAVALGQRATPAVEALVSALSHRCGYVSAVSAVALRRTRDAGGAEALARYWQAVAWDGSLRAGANY